MYGNYLSLEEYHAILKHERTKVPSTVLIRNQNKELGRSVHVDIKLRIEGSKLVIVLYDDGLPFDPVGQMSDPNNSELIHLSGKVLTGLAPDSEYRRIMELNSTRLVIR